MRTPILCYHKVGEPHERFLNVSVRDFRRQVAFLARRYRLIPLRDLYAAEGRCVVLTFDDAYVCSTEPLLQAAKDHDATGTVFPVTAFVGDMSRWDGENARQLADWDSLTRLRDAGYEIGNHTHTHADLSAPIPSVCGSERTAGERPAPGPVMLSPSKHDVADRLARADSRERAATESMLRQAQHDETGCRHDMSGAQRETARSAAEEMGFDEPRDGESGIWAEIAAAEEELVRCIGVRPKTFAYPFGRYGEVAVRAVRARGYLAAVTVRFGIAGDRHDPHILPRILISYSDGLAGLLYKLYIRPLLQGRR
ncbi:MAG: polysaccharide deacetylase family protein [Fimbriimonadia bacterium]|jgi:peptidoglycan/xylan/chitin deacetylase (PgdA/CDA1 family)